MSFDQDTREDIRRIAAALETSNDINRVLVAPVESRSELSTRLDAALRRISELERDIAVLKGPHHHPELLAPIELATHLGCGCEGPVLPIDPAHDKLVNDLVNQRVEFARNRVPRYCGSCPSEVPAHRNFCEVCRPQLPDEGDTIHNHVVLNTPDERVIE